MNEKPLIIKQNAILGISITTFLMLAGSIFTMGRIIERQEARLAAAVTATQFQVWEYRTQRSSPGWNPANMIEIREDMKERGK